MLYTDEMPDDTSGSSNNVRPNKIALDAGLVHRFKTLYTNLQRGASELEALAYNVRLQYLLADASKYDPAFEKWWCDFEMNKVFGSRANFTRYAAAGEAMERAEINKHADRMPITLSARYEVSLLTAEEIARCLENRYTRSAVGAEPTAPKKPAPVIHPNATAKEIRNWKKRWRNPKASDGTSSGDLTIEMVANIEKAISTALEPFKSVAVVSEINELLRRTRRRLQRAAEKSAKKKNGNGSG